MQDEILLTISVVTDDSTGIWHVGELEFGVVGTCREYIKEPENRSNLADWLQWLSDQCRSSQAPFRDLR